MDSKRHNTAVIYNIQIASEGKGRIFLKKGRYLIVFNKKKDIQGSKDSHSSSIILL